jgi:hypothetical protein
MIIPVGIDCGNAEFFKKNNLRSFSFPFDWIVTYGGVADIIKKDFHNFIPKNNNEKLNSEYSMLFVHNDFPNDTEKVLRRIDRFKNILKTTDEKITFVRKGHAFHHHGECDKIKNDIRDAEELDIALQIKYPKLKYEIIVILVCSSCFNPDETYITTLENIKIHNISTPIVDDNKYNEYLLKLFNL